MGVVESGTLPQDSLLQTYAANPDCYTDCYFAEVDQPVDLTAYMPAFYNSWLFRLERFVLAVFARRPSRDSDAERLAQGEVDHYAAWAVEARSDDELLMCDMSGRTRSWFLVLPRASGARLYFGSAVVPTVHRKTGKPTMGVVFKALLGFHKFYSWALLRLAVARLR